MQSVWRKAHTCKASCEKRFDSGLVGAITYGAQIGASAHEAATAGFDFHKVKLLATRFLRALRFTPAEGVQALLHCDRQMPRARTQQPRLGEHQHR